MKLTQLVAAVALAAAFGLATARSMPIQLFSGYPLVKLNISGTFYYTTNSSNTQKVPLKKVSYNSQTLINLLNASPAATE